MTSLNMSGNLLVDVDEDLREMRMLEELDLSRNKIVSLLSSISTMTALKRLIISHNPIQALPYGLWALNNLQLLEVTGCDIKFPPQDVVSKGVKSLLNFQRMLERGR
jgi:Leucine-rich repeat (LRR) protein